MNQINSTNPHTTGEFNAHPNLKRCKLITDNGEEVPWHNVAKWQYEINETFQKFMFEYNYGKKFTITTRYDNEKIHQQVKWNDSNCKC